MRGRISRCTTELRAGPMQMLNRHNGNEYAKAARGNVTDMNVSYCMLLKMRYMGSRPRLPIGKRLGVREMVGYCGYLE